MKQILMMTILFIGNISVFASSADCDVKFIAQMNNSSGQKTAEKIDSRDKLLDVDCIHFQESFKIEYENNENVYLVYEKESGGLFVFANGFLTTFQKDKLIGKREIVEGLGYSIEIDCRE